MSWLANKKHLIRFNFENMFVDGCHLIKIFKFNKDYKLEERYNISMKL